MPPTDPLPFCKVPEVVARLPYLYSRSTLSLLISRQQFVEDFEPSSLFVSVLIENVKSPSETFFPATEDFYMAIERGTKNHKLNHILNLYSKMF